MNNAADIYLTIFSVTLVLLLLVGTVISLLFIYQNKQIRNRQELSRVREHYEREILKTTLEIKEQTLKTISQEIHDNVGQILSLANLSLSSLELKNDDQQKDKVESIMQLISKSIGDLRNLSKMLDPDGIARQSLSDCLRYEVALLKKTGAFVTDFQQTGNEIPIESSKKLLIYRIVQESVNNVIKHSKASHLDFAVHFGESIVISILDNGKGFDPNDSYTGAGLRNMRSRTELMNGKIFIESNRGTGTKMILEVPVN